MGARNVEKREQLRQEMDELALGFRLSPKAGEPREGWLKAMRLALGIPTVEVARRLKVSKWDVYGLEKSEQQWRIMLGTLRRAAEAMDCDLVYALVPREGTLEEMAERRKLAQEAAHERQKRQEKELWKSPVWRAAARQALLASAKRLGVQIDDKGPGWNRDVTRRMR